MSAAAAARPAVRLYFFRHGTSECNLLKKWQGAQDIPLAASGVEQAEAAAQRLAGEGLRFDRAFTSDLQRAATTAAVLHAACGRGGSPVVEDARLRECSLGAFEGMVREDIKGPNAKCAAQTGRRDPLYPHSHTHGAALSDTGRCLTSSKG